MTMQSKCDEIRQHGSHSKETSLFLILDGSTFSNEQQFQVHLQHQLESKDIQFTISQFQPTGSTVQVEVRFPSMNTAKRMGRLLSVENPGIQVSLVEFSSDSIRRAIEKARSTMEAKHIYHIIEHDAKIDQLIRKQQELQQKSKKLTFDEVERVTTNLKVMHSEMQELRQQKEEFLRASEKIKQDLLKVETSLDSEINPSNHMITQLQKKFAQECSRLFKALPIYARRQDIIDTVSRNQVVVLIGETGSGKSTQVVQYLQYGGFADNGLIVCTQPRKIAAISLANHVSTEMCTSPGEIVGYHMSTMKKTSHSTKIIYMTDHTLLNECIADPLLHRYSCVVIDEAHERSLDTDILLAFVKRCLSAHPELRVIITSATIDPEVFVKYFGGSDVCPIVKVSGRMFPVDVIWNPLNVEQSPMNRDIVVDCVKVVKIIHQQEPDGDVLVFLTSPHDIEIACQTATEVLGVDPTLIVLPLHGRLQPDEQKKVFEQHPGKRKIVFSTNVAETSVTIPGIKYIVDSGLAKEICFDPKRNMTSLEVCLISKSSAEQRKGRAGRVSAGKCYRLYTQEQYESMRERTPPEILRIHLIHAVLKLHEFGITDILSFDFVEKPDKATLQAAVDTLQFLGATNGTTLTPFGQKLALLPIDPQLGKVLLDGIEAGIGLEAAVSVAISSHGSNIFFRSGTDEMKQESDRKKIRFVQPGDQMTCLSVYKEWSSQKKEQRNKWCVENYINAKVMRLVEDTVKELRYILSHNKHFKVDLPKVMPPLSTAETHLPKLYFLAFLQNLGVYLGHPLVGYMTPGSVQDDPLIPFPGSSLVQCNDNPQYVIYEKTLKTSKHFLLQVLPVKEAWIEEALAQGKLSCHPVGAVKEHMVHPFTIENIGRFVFSQAVKKNIKELLEKLKLICNGSPVQIDLKQQELGKLIVFSSIAYHKPLKQFLMDKFLIIRNDLKKGFWETGVTNPNDDVKLVIGQGGVIEHVLMPHQFRSVIVKGPCMEVINEAMVTLLNHGDIIKTQFKQFSKECSFHATFSHPQMAVAAVSAKSDLPDDVTVQPLVTTACCEPGFKFFRLKVEWVRRDRKNFAFLTFTDEEWFQTASVALCFPKFDFKIRKSKTDPMQLFVTNVGEHIDETELRRVVAVTWGGPEEAYTVKFGLEKSFETTPEEHAALSYQLNRLLSRYAPTNQYKLNLLHPKPQHTFNRAFVDFPDPSIGQRVMKDLSDEEIHGKPLNVQPMLSTSVRFTPQIHKVVSEGIDAVKKQVEKEFTCHVVKFVSKNDRYGNPIVQVQSDNENAFSVSKTLLSDLISPLVKDCQSPFLQLYILSQTSRQKFSEIQAATKTVIYVNTKTMTINIYGLRNNRELASLRLDWEIKQLEGRGISIRELQLKARGNPPGLMKHIVSKFGVDLSGILRMEGVQSATLEPRKQILTIFSSDEAIQSIQQVIDEYSSSFQHHMPEPDALECSICLCEIEHSSEVYLLECCGHASHIECIQLQVSANVVNFPLQCAAEGCLQNFVWQDCENLFKRTTLTLKALVDASLRSYLAANKEKVRNCPTPDCGMVYAVSEDEQRFVCSHCGIQICTACHVQYHDGLTCAMNKRMEPSEKDFQRWLQKDERRRKLCPKCATPIEKIAGCNNVHCTQCHSYICWVCTKYFEEEQLCYKHLREYHGGFND